MFKRKKCGVSVKKVLSLLTALVMILSMTPVFVFAEGGSAQGYQSAVETGRDNEKQQVRVKVENTTFTPESEDLSVDFWYGTLVDRWVDIDSNSTMMSCIVAALEAGGYSQTGAESNYISEIAGLSAFDGGSMSGWMGTLNDWFVNEGFNAFTVADGKLAAGDIINIMYTCEYGADCGGTWGNNDTSLEGLTFSSGTLDTVFSSSKEEYTLTVPADTDSVYVTPTAANKNFQARIFVGETEYKRTAAVPVSDGTVITVKVGDPSWPNMNSGQTATTYTASTYEVTVAKEQPAAQSVNITVTAPNAASMALFAEDDTAMETVLFDGSASASVPEGDYRLCLYDENSVCLGSIMLPVGENNKDFTVYAVSVTCGNGGWVLGTDYTIEPHAMSGGSEAPVSRLITMGEAGNTFLCLNGDKVSAKIIPSEAKKGDGFAPANAVNSNGQNMVTGAGYAQLSGTCEQAALLSVTYPYADTDGDNENDFVLEVGQMTNYYIYSYVEPDNSVKSDDNQSMTAEFNGLSKGDYFYRVTNPKNNDAVTYGSYVSVKVGNNPVTVTAAQMHIGDDLDSNTLITDFSKNQYDVADLYLSVSGDLTGETVGYDGAAGQLSMSVGQKVTLYPYRNWLAIEGISNAKVTEPDFHFQVINIDGNPVSVAENTENSSSKHSYAINADGTGTAVLLVTYDAMTHDVSGNFGGFFSAIWPENTGVIIVTVDRDTNLSSNMTINESLNTDIKNKYVVDRIDAELDVLYYTGTQGASYSFKPEEGTAVTMAVCGYSNGKMTFGQFSASGVETAQDGTVTLNGLTEGKTIVKLEKNGKVKYQVIRAMHTDVVVTNADNEKIVDTAEGLFTPSKAVVPGEKLSVLYTKLYHPANKLSGIYNMSAVLNITDECGNTFAGTSNQYNFASTAAAHKVDVTVPEDADNTYSVAGTIKANGFGSYFGYHRLLKYEEGKTPNFTADSQTGYFGQLPGLTFSVAKSLQVNLTVIDGNDSSVENFTVSVTSGGTGVTVEDGTFTGYPGKTYDYVITAAGHPRTINSFTVPENASETYTAVITVSDFESGAWNGTDNSEPSADEDVYQIGTGAELAWFASKVNDGTAANANAVLTADINLSNMDWTPVGTSTNKYIGTFDGQGHHITGLYISSDSTYRGLFGYVDNGAVRNLGVSGQVKGGQYTAGIVAYLGGTGSIESCFNSVNVTGGKNTGGIAGFQNTTALIVNCYNKGNVNGGSSQLVGGISGGGTNYVAKDTITNCYNIGTVYSSNTYGGAITGGAQVGNVTNTYYLEGTWTGTKPTNVNKAGVSKTSAELKNLADTLGEAYTADTAESNGGYPILKWQKSENEHIHKDADFDGICDTCDEKLGTVRTASVDYTSQFGGVYLHAPKSSVQVSSNIAELFGYEDDVNYLENVSVLDVLVQAHIDVFGEAFTKTKATDYLVMGQYGSPDTMFEVPSLTAYGGFFLNGGYANDGTESQWGGYNGTLVTTQAVTDGDLVEFFFYEDENYGDTYNWFIGENGYARSFEAVAGSPVELTLKGFFAMNAYLFKDAAEMRASQNAFKVEDAQIYIIDTSTGAKTALDGAVTDKDGKVSLAFDEPGTYVIASYGTEDCNFAQIMSLTQVEVSAASLSWQNCFENTRTYLNSSAGANAPVVGSTGGEWMVIGLARSGADISAWKDSYLRNVLTYVNSNINDKEQLHKNKSTDNSRLIIALTSLGYDVTDVGGHNLLKGLASMTYLKKQGINGPIWALIAFDSHNYDIPDAGYGDDQATREKIIEYILGKQLSDGGWALSGTSGDPDMTGMAVQALAPYYGKNTEVTASLNKAVECMAGMIGDDGSLASWGTVNSESCAQVITALAAMKIDLAEDTRFVKGSTSLIDTIVKFYVEDTSKCGFAHVLESTTGYTGGEYNQMATEQAFYALTAYSRLKNGSTALYDMSDVTIAEKPEGLKGDVNGDGEINSADAALVYAYHNGKTDLTPEQLVRAEVTGDSFVNSADAAKIYAYHNGKISTF